MLELSSNSASENRVKLRKNETPEKNSVNGEGHFVLIYLDSFG